MRVYWIFLALVVSSCGNFDGAAMHVSGPMLDEASLAWMERNATRKADVINKIGEPSFVINVKSGEVLIYRELLESVSSSGNIIFRKKYYVAYERFVILETVEDVVIDWNVLTRRYDEKRASDIEFGLTPG